MPNTKQLAILCILILLLALSPALAQATAVMLTDDQLDQIQGSALASFEDIDKIIAQVFQLVLTNRLSGDTPALVNVNALNSAFVIQSNIAFSLNSPGNITQTNTADIVNGLASGDLHF